MIEQQLTEALEGLQAAIASSDGAGIKDGLAKVEALTERNRSALDAQLKHYLRNRSYLKALAFLKGESDIPKGRCGGRNDFS